MENFLDPQTAHAAHLVVAFLAMVVGPGFTYALLKRKTDEFVAFVAALVVGVVIFNVLVMPTFQAGVLQPLNSIQIQGEGQ